MTLRTPAVNVPRPSSSPVGLTRSGSGGGGLGSARRSSLGLRGSSQVWGTVGSGIQQYSEHDQDLEEVDSRLLSALNPTAPIWVWGTNGFRIHLPAQDLGEPPCLFLLYVRSAHGAVLCFISDWCLCVWLPLGHCCPFATSFAHSIPLLTG